MFEHGPPLLIAADTHDIDAGKAPRKQSGVWPNVTILETHSSGKAII